MGRISKRWKVGLIAFASFGLMAATIPAAILITNTQTAQLENAKRRCETGTYSSHKVVMQNEKAVPAHTTAKLCDTLTIINLDGRERLVAFGPHEHHVSYDGVSERVLAQGQSLTITLITAGTFHFHDHTDDIVQGTFTVTSPN